MNVSNDIPAVRAITDRMDALQADIEEMEREYVTERDTQAQATFRAMVETERAEIMAAHGMATPANMTVGVAVMPTDRMGMLEQRITAARAEMTRLDDRRLRITIASW